MYIYITIYRPSHHCGPTSLPQIAFNFSFHFRESMKSKKNEKTTININAKTNTKAVDTEEMEVVSEEVKKMCIIIRDLKANFTSRMEKMKKKLREKDHLMMEMKNRMNEMENRMIAMSQQNQPKTNQIYNNNNNNPYISQKSLKVHAIVQDQIIVQIREEAKRNNVVILSLKKKVRKMKEDQSVHIKNLQLKLELSKKVNKKLIRDLNKSRKSKKTRISNLESSKNEFRKEVDKLEDALCTGQDQMHILNRKLNNQKKYIIEKDVELEKVEKKNEMLEKTIGGLGFQVKFLNGQTILMSNLIKKQLKNGAKVLRECLKIDFNIDEVKRSKDAILSGMNYLKQLDKEADEKFKRKFQEYQSKQRSQQRRNRIRNRERTIRDREERFELTHKMNAVLDRMDHKNNTSDNPLSSRALKRVWNQMKEKIENEGEEEDEEDQLINDMQKKEEEEKKSMPSLIFVESDPCSIPVNRSTRPDGYDKEKEQIQLHYAKELSRRTYHSEMKKSGVEKKDNHDNEDSDSEYVVVSEDEDEQITPPVFI